ncbi:Sorting nexin-16 [Eumeta japonica]|uniref:Sorting nexin-16 n=1 Tax=Eumeta variegata TaxID=151549 RepID=A0A4C1XRA1_EUMVA|nr:Sorting nexin-16 [Eumeta japonica]
METVQQVQQISTNNILRDSMNNQVSSTSHEDIGTNSDTLSKFNNFYKSRYDTASDNETEIRQRSMTRIQPRNHHKSMGNINDEDLYDRNLNRVQNSMSNLDVSLHSDELKKFESLQIPIVGYEVMEERARFTIYKLKVEDDKTDQSWLVFRRYTDFVRLYSRLRAEKPNLMLPLPGKRLFRDNFDPTFLEERVRGLQMFVNTILKKLPNHPLVREFFCLDEPPQALSYQPEVQAVYGALEDSITALKLQVKQKDNTILRLQKKLAELEAKMSICPNCSTNTV